VLSVHIDAHCKALPHTIYQQITYFKFGHEFFICNRNKLRGVGFSTGLNLMITTVLKWKRCQHPQKRVLSFIHVNCGD